MPTRPPALPREVTEVLAAAPRRVLHVDDNAMSLRLLAQMLERLPGVRVSSLSDPLQAVLLAPSLQPDLILLDIRMEPIDGFEVLARLRASAALVHVPVVAVTAEAAPAELLRMRQTGFDRVLPFPLDLVQLLDTVAALLDTCRSAAAA